MNKIYMMHTISEDSKVYEAAEIYGNSRIFNEYDIFNKSSNILIICGKARLSKNRL